LVFGVWWDNPQFDPKNPGFDPEVEFDPITLSPDFPFCYCPDDHYC
jgi:hypothetical protein